MLLGALVDLVCFQLLVPGSTPYIIRSPWYLRLGSIWFGDNIFRHSFISWLVVRNRLQTRESISRWYSYISSNCVLCISGVELRRSFNF